MEKTLYFLMPKFCKWKVEQKIINELGAQCYRVLNRHTKYFENNDMWIVIKKDIVTVHTKKEMVAKVEKVFYGR